MNILKHINAKSLNVNINVFINVMETFYTSSDIYNHFFSALKYTFFNVLFYGEGI